MAKYKINMLKIIIFLYMSNKVLNKLSLNNYIYNSTNNKSNDYTQ